MSYAPSTIVAVRDYLMSETGLSSVSLGIVGDAAHTTGYHLGKDRIYDGAGPGIGDADYSVQLARDKAGLTNAAAALDVGMFSRLREMSTWIVAQCLAGAPGTSDLREIIYTADGVTVQRWSGVDNQIHTGPGNGDLSHLQHTHFDWFRDSEMRSKLAVFEAFFTEAGIVEQTFTMIPGAKTGTLVVKGDVQHWYQRLRDGKLYGPIDPVTFGVKQAYGPVSLVVPIPGGAVGEDRKTAYVVGDEAAALLVKDVDFTADEPAPTIVSVNGNQVYP